jgi:hypothetical protein
VAERLDRQSLGRLAPLLDALAQRGLPAPRLPDSMVQRAAQLEVDLPASEA